MYEPAEREFFTVPIEDVRVPDGRTANEAVVKTLVESIGRIGLINPLTVVKKNDAFELVAGMNRLQACRELGLTWVWVVVLSEEEPVHEIEFDENLARVHLSPEQLAEHRKWVKAEMRRRLESGESVRRVARNLGLSKSAVERKRAGVPNGTPASRRTGTDGKSYPATQATSDQKTARAQKARALREAGKTIAEVASALGVSRRTAASDLAAAPAGSDEPAPTEDTAPVIVVEVGAVADLVRRACGEDDEEAEPVSRETFASLIGTTLGVLAAWDSGAQVPTGPELALLKILSEPESLESWIHRVVIEGTELPRDVSERKLAAFVHERVAAVLRGEIRLHFRQRRAS